jgi:DNA (cytosine-5)-methyltransferase 1
VTRPRLLDLFSGAGGAAMGYHRAGFDVVGVDNRPQPRYPFEFHQGDVMTGYGGIQGWIDYLGHRRPFDAIHTSPPCQDYSKAMRHLSGGYPRLIEHVRARLTATGLPWVIENVDGAPLPAQGTLDGHYGLELCGTMFGLPVWWHRLFETWAPIAPPRGCDHSVQPMNPNRRDRPGGRTASAEWSRARGTEWMLRNEARQAIPPAYTEHIGAQLMEHLGRREHL